MAARKVHLTFQLFQIHHPLSGPLRVLSVPLCVFAVPVKTATVWPIGNAKQSKQGREQNNNYTNWHRHTQPKQSLSCTVSRVRQAETERGSERERQTEREEESGGERQLLSPSVVAVERACEQLKPL